MTLFARVGIPEEILTDCGAKLTSQLVEEMYRLLGVKAIHTSPYHPQTDGMVQRFHSTMKMMLRKTMEKFDNQWEKALPYILVAYWEVPNATTGFSPFEMLYSRQVRGPLDVLKETYSKRDGSRRTQPRRASSHMYSGYKRKAKEKTKAWYDQTPTPCQGWMTCWMD